MNDQNRTRTEADATGETLDSARRPTQEPTRREAEAPLTSEETLLEEQDPGRAGDLAYGEHIGPYRIVRKLGEGGMGEVYEAEQEQPVRRHVALKLIKLGMDSRKVLARFDSERQALALMNHPSIAKVFDAGTTERGRPYFVMEFAAGIPLEDYCDRHKLGVNDRLKLFIQVCEGVQHAHQKGIIHRDLKPGNILVEEIDGKPVPKIIDFGIARATDQRLTDMTIATELGAIIGTPEYMSPEQAGLTDLDIDTRTDVYSLGVVLYELLTGRLPFDSAELRRAGVDGFRQQILEVEPARPSTRVTREDEADRLARRRDSDARALTRELKGDLDWIVMKAIEKDRERRYASAWGLAADVQRHMAHEPVLAGPPSVSYRAGKFVRRHRYSVIAASAVTVALILGVIGTSVNMVKAQTAERKTRALSAYLGNLFRSSGGEGQTADETMAELKRGREALRAELEGEPQLQALLLEMIGRTYRAIGENELAEEVLREAVDVTRAAHGEDSLELAGVSNSLAGLLIRRADFEAALPVVEEAYAIHRGHPETPALELGRTLNNLGTVRHHLDDDFEAAMELYREALEITERELGPEHEATGKMYSQIGNLLRKEKRYAEAVDYLERGLAIREHAPTANQLDVARTLHNLGLAQYSGKQPQLAVEALRRSIDIKEATAQGLDLSLSVLSQVYAELGDYRAAIPLCERALSIRERRLPAGHKLTLFSMRMLAELYERNGEADKAAAMTQRLDRLGVRS